MTIDTKKLLLDHAAEQLDEPAMAFVPGAPKPLLEVRGAYALSESDMRIALRDETEGPPPAPMGVRGHFQATGASVDSGPPIRCSLNVGSGSRGSLPDPHVFRDRLILSERERTKAGDAAPPFRLALGGVVPGPLQLAIWNSLRGEGVATPRSVREAPQAARRAKKPKANATAGEAAKVSTVSPPPPRKLATVIDRIHCSLEEAASELRRRGYDATEHEISTMCDAMEVDVFERLMRIGVIHKMVRVRGHVRADGSTGPSYWRSPARVRVETAAAAEGDEMAKNEDLLEGWKAIVDVVGRSETTCRKLAGRADRPLPVRDYLGKPRASKKEVERWCAAEDVPWGESA